MNYLIMAISISLAIAGQMLMKRGMMAFGTFPVSQLLTKVIPMFLNPWVFVGLFCFGLSSVFWLVVLSRLPLSLVYPMVSIGYIIVALLSIVFFKETISLIRWAGIIVIVLGVFLISRS
ncbi:MAG: SMR family transporter [Candidatus Margulisbacteria bacterium]|nr:SMR family transporter [Candidatus Margulisiibacteriota bacterium]